MQKEFRRKLDALADIFELVEDFVSANNIKERDAFQLGLVVEELFANFVRHNTGGRERILVRITRNGNQLVITLEDFDVGPFDPEKSCTTDICEPLSKRKPGGLGILLVRSMVDRLTYEHRDGALIVTAVKNLEEANV